MHAPMPDSSWDRAPTPQEELSIITAARRDPAAFAPLYDLHAGSIYRFCFLRLGDSDLADDLTSRVFIRAIERLHQYSPRHNASFRSWLFAIARNMLADDWRRRREVHLVGQACDDLRDSEPGPEYLTIHRSEIEQLRVALQRLPQRQREIVELRLVGFRTNEIADTLGISIAAVKSAQTRAYHTLRLTLSPPTGVDR